MIEHGIDMEFGKHTLSEFIWLVWLVLPPKLETEHGLAMSGVFICCGNPFRPP